MPNDCWFCKISKGIKDLDICHYCNSTKEEREKEVSKD